MHLLGFLLFGLIVGLLARAFMPGRQSMGLLATMLLGVVGSFLGGLVGNMLFAHGRWDQPSTAGWIGSILGSLLLLALLGRTRRPLFR
ncbi:MAG TPA: GlsB/YeaQ/YmgE family stress response membrane protein [Polyangiales bacterium]|nr:GlsB/YeaQ/YmgE family stress response membrane protein [Polyangiales bacterium]